MKRLMIMTVGKTHSGKTTFAKALEQELDNSFVMDQDNHAEFINTYYEKLLPRQGPNTLKYALSRMIADYAIENTDLHLIVCNSNRSQKGRLYLLEDLYNKERFVRIIVHFNILDDILRKRVLNSERSKSIFRSASSFEEVLLRQHAEDVIDPTEDEADHLFVVKDNEETDDVIRKIVRIAQNL